MTIKKTLIFLSDGRDTSLGLQEVLIGIAEYVFGDVNNAEWVMAQLVFDCEKIDLHTFLWQTKRAIFTHFPYKLRQISRFYMPPRIGRQGKCGFGVLWITRSVLGSKKWQPEEVDWDSYEKWVKGFEKEMRGAYPKWLKKLQNE